MIWFYDSVTVTVRVHNCLYFCNIKKKTNSNHFLVKKNSLVLQYKLYKLQTTNYKLQTTYQNKLCQNCQFPR